MKWILVPLLWILFLMVLKEVHGESKLDLLRCKRDHEPEDIEGTDSSESIISAEIKDIESNTTTNDDKNTEDILKSVSNDVPLKKLHKRRKNKRVKNHKTKSVVPSTTTIDQTDDDTSETNFVIKGDTWEAVVNNKSLIATETKEKEENLQSAEAETECNNNETSQVNVVPEAFINSAKLGNRDDSKETVARNIENSNLTNDTNSFHESKDEIETQSINNEEEKSEELIEDKDSCNSNDISYLSKEFVNNLDTNEVLKETKIAETPQEKNTNCKENMNDKLRNGLQDKELTKKVEVKEPKQLLNQVSAEKLSDAKPDLLTTRDIPNVDIPTKRDKENDLKSNICTSSSKNDNSLNEDINKKPGPALSYEQENLQHCIRRYYIYPPLAKTPQSNYFVNDQPTWTQSNRIDFPDNTYPQNTDNFIYNTPNNGYINDYEVKDANGHRIPFSKSGEYTIKKPPVTNTYQASSNPYQQNLNYNPSNDSTQNKKSTNIPNLNHNTCNDIDYRDQYKKTTNIPYLNEYIANDNVYDNTYHDVSNKYIPSSNKLNYANKKDLIQDAKVSNVNNYIPKSNENRNYNDDAIKFTNNKNYNDYKINPNYDEDFYSNDKSLAKQTFSKINENYSKINHEDIRTANGFTINENIDRKISHDIQTENFHSIGEEIWRSSGNRKLFISDCNKAN